MNHRKPTLYQQLNNAIRRRSIGALTRWIMYALIIASLLWMPQLIKYTTSNTAKEVSK